MTSVSRYRMLQSKLAWFAWLAVAATAAYLFGVVRLPQPVPAAAPAVPEPPARAGTAIADLEWDLFRNPSADIPVAGELAARYRLAGTFLVYGASVENRRKAIITDLQSGAESLVTEGDILGESVDVVRVLHDRVVLRDGQREEQLWLTFSAATAGTAASTQAGSESEAVQAGLSRFGGKRVGKNRWVFSRQKLLAYYTELMNEPERLVKVFDSLHPLYNEDQAIDGYQLRVEGEPEFFDSVGFQEGDAVRKVNKLPMTNRRRAEFFIKQFVEGRASAFVIDIERGGEKAQLIYQFR